MHDSSPLQTAVLLTEAGGGELADFHVVAFQCFHHCKHIIGVFIVKLVPHHVLLVLVQTLHAHDGLCHSVMKVNGKCPQPEIALALHQGAS